MTALFRRQEASWQVGRTRGSRQAAVLQFVSERLSSSDHLLFFTFHSTFHGTFETLLFFCLIWSHAHCRREHYDCLLQEGKRRQTHNSEKITLWLFASLHLLNLHWRNWWARVFVACSALRMASPRLLVLLFLSYISLQDSISAYFVKNFVRGLKQYITEVSLWLRHLPPHSSHSSQDLRLCSGCS